MNIAIFEKTQPLGTVQRRAFQAAKLKALLEQKTHCNLDEAYNPNGTINFDVLCIMALEIITPEELKACIEKCVKKQFADNFLWKFIYKHFNLDLAVPFVTGYYTTKPIKHNLVVNNGHAGYAGQIGGTTSTAFTAMAYGTGVTAAAATDTALQTEVARAAATISRVTTSVTNDTAQWVHLFTAAGTQAITEEGLLDNNVSGGNLLAHNVFSAVNMLINDTIQFTHKIQS